MKWRIKSPEFELEMWFIFRLINVTEQHYEFFASFIWQSIKFNVNFFTYKQYICN